MTKEEIIQGLEAHLERYSDGWDPDNPKAMHPIKRELIQETLKYLQTEERIKINGCTD